MDAPAPGPRTRRIVLVVIGIIALLCVVFGVTFMRQKAEYSEYRAATLEQQPLPWTVAPMSVEQCVEFTVDWAMACRGLESWCANEAPQLTRRCLGSQDRTQACAAFGDAVADTHFGYRECEALRESVEGRYTQRAHKKFCAASYRAVAAFCGTEGAP